MEFFSKLFFKHIDRINFKFFNKNLSSTQEVLKEDFYFNIIDSLAVEDKSSLSSLIDILSHFRDLMYERTNKSILEGVRIYSSFNRSFIVE